jgi:hypothetical protein
MGDAERLDAQCRKDNFSQFCRRIRGQDRIGASGVTNSAITTT